MSDCSCCIYDGIFDNMGARLEVVDERMDGSFEIGYREVRT
jgi:hypothetical protein